MKGSLMATTWTLPDRIAALVTRRPIRPNLGRKRDADEEEQQATCLTGHGRTSTAPCPEGQEGVQQRRPKAKEPQLKIKSDPQPEQPRQKGQALNLLKAPGDPVTPQQGGRRSHSRGAADTRSTWRPFPGEPPSPQPAVGRGGPQNGDGAAPTAPVLPG